MRHYGRIIQNMIAATAAEPDQAKREYLTILLANKMKQQYILWNKDDVENRQIVEDIQTLSGGILTCDFPGFYLKHGWQLVNKNDRTQQMQQRKKKK